jgi:hypothetical protein
MRQERAKDGFPFLFRAEEEVVPMSFSRKVLPVILCALLSVFIPGAAQAQQGMPQRAPGASDATVLGNLCFQCHSASMWSDHRSDRRGWEGVLYRMVGRGALWTEEDIRSMANALATGFGPGPLPVPGKPAK